MDDEPDLCDIFRHWLEAAGCVRVFTAVNGQDALAVLAMHTVDLLVTDVRMPIMGGIPLVRRLAEMGKDVPSIIFVSGFGDVDQREMYSLGVESFLAKPLGRGEFIEAVEHALAERSTLWLMPMKIAPRQTIQLEFEQRREGVPIRLGRGGFSVHCDEALSLGKVRFQCRFLTQQTEMTGEGYVRWRSKSEAMVGVEFFFLDGDCRGWVLEEMASTGPHSFIPGS